MRTLLCNSAVLAGLCTSGCHFSQDTPEPDDQRLHRDLLQVASKYETWGRADDAARFAPRYCAAPPDPVVRFSKSNDSETHGEKLYTVFVKDRDAYVRLTQQASPVGQVIVRNRGSPRKPQT